MSFYFQRLLFCLGLLLPLTSFAQSRCEMIFAAEQDQILEQLAGLQVDVENTQDSTLRRTLNINLKNRKALAKKSGLSLESLNARIEKIRREREIVATETSERDRRTRESESKIISKIFVSKGRLDVGSALASVQFLPDSEQFVGITLDYNLQNVLYNLKTGEKKSLPGFRGEVSLTADGRYLLGRSFESLSLLDLQTGKPIQRYEGINRLGTIAISPDGRFVAAAPPYSAYDSKVYLWDAKSGKLLKEFLENRDPNNDEPYILHLEFSVDGKRLLGVQNYTRSTVWDTQTLQVVGHRGDISENWSGNMNAEGTLVIRSQRSDNQDPPKTYLWNLTTKSEALLPFPGSRSRISADGSRAIVYDDSSTKPTVSIIDLKTGLLKFAINVPYEIMSATLSPDGKKVLVTTRPGHTLLWEEEGETP
jgi:WD40 repeat protein